MKKRTAALLVVIMTVFFHITAFAATAGQMPSGISLEDMEVRIDEYVNEYIGKTSPGAAVVVLKDSEIIFSKGYGYADMENGITVDPSKTVFEYGSVSKLFVYTAIMRLVEQGQLDLYADIQSYLPEGFLRKLRYDEPITLLNVMNHTTGFEDFLFDVILTSQDIRPGFEQVLLDCQPEQVYHPGIVSAYSNYAVALAAYIAQGIIGQDFYKYLMDTVFLPLNMNSTSAHPALADHSILMQCKAMGYYPQPDGGFKKGDWSYIPLYPVGAVNGTAEDLARFAMALLPSDGQISPLFASRETLDVMFSQSHAIGPGPMGFAHGFIERDGRYRSLGHGGNTACFSAQLNIVPEKRFGVVVLTNAASEMDLTEGLTQLLLGTEQKDTGYDGSLPRAQEVEGTYISARRSHTGFLKLYGYLSLLEVKALDSDKIEMRLGGQSATLVQTAPYVFERIMATGPIFKYYFGTVYFKMADGRVERISGDFMPLPRGHTPPWLWVDIIVIVICTAFFLLVPVALLIRRLVWKRKSAENLSAVLPARWLYIAFVLCGTGLLVNNAILLLRMLMNNYRSFSEVRSQILLNYPLVVLAAVIGFVLAMNWKKSLLSGKDKAIFIAAALLFVSFIALLAKWQFFHVLV